MAMRPIFALRDFLRKEGSSGILLIFATVVGIFLANSPIKESYKKTLAAGFKIDTNYFYLSLTTTKIINYLDRKSTRLNSSHMSESRMPSSA